MSLDDEASALERAARAGDGAALFALAAIRRRVSGSSGSPGSVYLDRWFDRRMIAMTERGAAWCDASPERYALICKNRHDPPDAWCADCRGDASVEKALLEGWKNR